MIFVKMKCPNPTCDKTLVVQVEMKGRKGKCEKCGYKFIIPDLAPQQPGALTIIARRFAGDKTAVAPPKPAADDEEPPPLPPPRTGRKK
jgi:hypothetical protein